MINQAKTVAAGKAVPWRSCCLERKNVATSLPMVEERELQE
jgi:hypothetical protein